MILINFLLELNLTSETSCSSAIVFILNLISLLLPINEKY